MNKKLLAVAVVGALASPLAFAQNVTLYGGIDVGLQHADSGQPGQKNFITSGSWYTSRVGIKGSDDLGGGLSAVLVAEHGLFADTGATDTVFWQRQIYGGLDSKQWGALTVGRQYTHMHNQSAGTGSLLATTQIGTLGFSLHQTRASNAIKYSSANYGGFNFGALYSLGVNGAGNTPATSGEDFVFSDNGKYWEAHAGFAKAPFAIDFAHARTKAQTATTAGDLKRNQLVGKWDAGAFAASAGFVTDKSDTGFAAAQTDRRVYWIQPGFRFGGSNEIYGTYAKEKDKTSAARDAKWFGVAYRHLFTKRTYAYAAWATVKNENGGGRSLYSYQGPTPNSAVGTGTADSDAKALSVGLAQEF